MAGSEEDGWFGRGGGVQYCMVVEKTVWVVETRQGWPYDGETRRTIYHADVRSEGEKMEPALLRAALESRVWCRQDDHAVADAMVPFLKFENRKVDRYDELEHIVVA